MKIPPLPKKDAVDHQTRDKRARKEDSLTSLSKKSPTSTNLQNLFGSLNKRVTLSGSITLPANTSIPYISTVPSSKLLISPLQRFKASIPRSYDTTQDTKSIEAPEKPTTPHSPTVTPQLRSRIPIPVKESPASSPVVSSSLSSTSSFSFTSHSIPPSADTDSSTASTSSALTKDLKQITLQRRFGSRIPINSSKASSPLTTSGTRTTPDSPDSPASFKFPSPSTTPKSSKSSQFLPYPNPSRSCNLKASHTSANKENTMTWFKKSKASASSGNVSKEVSVAKDAAAIRAAPITATLPTDVALKPGGESGSSPPINDNNNLQNTSENLTMHAILHGPVHESSASRNPSSSLMPTGDGHQQPAAKKGGPFSFLRKYTGGNRKKPKESLREQLLDSLTEFPFQSAFNNEAAHERYDPTTNNNKLAKAYTAQNKPRSDRDRDIQASRATFPPVISPFDRRKSRRDRIYKDGTSQHSHSPPPRAQAAPAVQKPTRPALRRNGNYPPTAPPSRHPSLDLRRVPHGTSLEPYTAYRELPPTAQGSQRSSLDLRRFSHHRIFPVHVDIASNQQLVDSESSLSPSSQSAFSSLDPFGYQFYLESVETAILEHQSLSHESEIKSGNSNQPLFDQQEEIGANFEVNSSPGQQHGPYGLYTTKEEVSQLDNKPQRERQDLAEKLHRRLLEEQNRMFEQRKRAALSGRAGRAGMLDVEHPSASNLKASYPPTKLSDSARSSAEMRRVGSKPSLQQDLERQCGPSFSRSTASSSRRTSAILDRRLQAEREALENVSRGRTSGVPEFQAHRTLNRGIMRHLSPSHDETYIPPPAYVSPKSSRINLVEIAESVRALANNGYTPRGRGSASLASDSLGNAATLTRRVSSSNVDGFTLSPRGKCSNITSAGASGRNSLDVPGGSLAFRRTKSLACVHPLSQVESVESRVPTPHPEICQQYRHVSMNVDHPEIPDIFEPPEEHREYGLYNTIAHPPNSAPRTDIRHLFPGYAEAGPSSSNQSTTPSGRPRILSTRAERAAERASRAAELEESVRTIRKRASDASVTGSLLTSRRSDINIPSTAATSSSVIARSATPAPTPPPQESDDTIIVNVPALPNAELQELRRVTTDMPIEFWLGRFSGMLDRIATMNLNVSGTDFNYKGYVMQRLKNDVGSEAAMKSFNDFYYYMINRRTGDEWYEGYKDRDRDVVKKIVLNEVDE